MAQLRNLPVIISPMKTPYPHLLLAAIIATGSAFAADPDTKASNVTVTFHESEKFTDARSSFGSDTDEGYLKIISEHLQKTAAKHLAAGQKLEITITDVDLAGDFIPGNVRNQDVRIIKEIYIPRIKLSFKLLDASGKVVKEGERKLSDLNFMMNTGIIGRNDSLFYDKELLSNWVSKEFKS
jgi:hypothetical protein